MVCVHTDRQVVESLGCKVAVFFVSHLPSLAQSLKYRCPVVKVDKNYRPISFMSFVILNLLFPCMILDVLFAVFTAITLDGFFFPSAVAMLVTIMIWSVFIILWTVSLSSFGIIAAVSPMNMSCSL